MKKPPFLLFRKAVTVHGQHTRVQQGAQGLPLGLVQRCNAIMTGFRLLYEFTKLTTMGIDSQKILVYHIVAEGL